jgi:NADH-quinone oxidoreductase subunit G
VQAVAKFQQEVGGALAGGDPGVRLLEPAASADLAYFTDVPAAFAPRTGKWLVLPLHHIFGAEELSAHAPGIAALAATPFLALHADDASKLGIAAGDDAQLRLDNTQYRLPIVLDGELPHGVAGLPVGLPGMARIALPAWGTIDKVGAP